MLIRAIAPKWATHLKNTVEKDCTIEEIDALNAEGYNIYFFANFPSQLPSSGYVDGSIIDTFTHVYVDMDLKDGKWPDKESFYRALKSHQLNPSTVVDSGNGVHVYWKVSDLDAMTHLRLQRRLISQFKTDVTIAKICQLMRLPGTMNTKVENDYKECKIVGECDVEYTSEQIDRILPPITLADEQYCQDHYNMTYSLESDIKINDILPSKFAQLIRSSKEVAEIWKGNTEDRSASDFRLAHIMWAHNFSKDEALSVLVNSAKALGRGPKHRHNYATNIINKVWVHEEGIETEELSYTVKDILSKKGDTLKGTRFPCHKWFDNTEHGFRLGQIIGLVAGSGVGKTSVALNMFMGFVENNPEYDHFFIPLEQPVNEIASRWKLLCGENTNLHEKVHLISNYDSNGGYRNLSFDTIQEHILQFQQKTGRKVGCVVIDHIGALSKKGAKGENQDLIDICHKMKAFAMSTNTLLVMQSQAPREKAGIGDLELNKDAAYGTVFFESYCDYLVTLWQPLKRCYTSVGCPIVTAFKFCKIRHKNQKKDVIKEDVRYALSFDPHTEKLRELTQSEDQKFEFHNINATNLRKQDRKTDVLKYTTIMEAGIPHGETNNDKDSGRTSKPIGVH